MNAFELKMNKSVLGITASAIFHLALGIGVKTFFITREPMPIFAELDLSMSSLVPILPNAGGKGGMRSEAWTVPKKGKSPIPERLPEISELKPVVQEDDNCPEPCHREGSGTGIGGSSEGAGVYIPASQTAKKPRWIGNPITSDDYPRVAREQGKDGRVVLSVLIDASGKVNDVRLLQGSYEALNSVALEKLRSATFTPAYDANGNAVACKVTLPIKFELK